MGKEVSSRMRHEDLILGYSSKIQCIFLNILIAFLKYYKFVLNIAEF